VPAEIRKNKTPMAQASTLVPKTEFTAQAWTLAPKTEFTAQAWTLALSVISTKSAVGI